MSESKTKYGSKNNDASADGTPEVIYKGRVPRIKYLSDVGRVGGQLIRKRLKGEISDNSLRSLFYALGVLTTTYKTELLEDYEDRIKALEKLANKED